MHTRKIKTTWHQNHRQKPKYALKIQRLLFNKKCDSLDLK